MEYERNLRSCRLEKQLLQKDMANILGISEHTYSHYESGDATIPIKHLIKCCDYFNISLDYVFNISNTKRYVNSVYFIDKIKSGKRLKEFRKENSLTQIKLAEILNTVHPVITNYENGKNIIATPFLYTICKNYGVSADYLLGLTDKPKYLEKI